MDGKAFAGIFQFNCCAIKGYLINAFVTGAVIFQFNCCAIKGNYAYWCYGGFAYFNSTVVRLKA